VGGEPKEKGKEAEGKREKKVGEVLPKNCAAVLEGR